MSAAARQDGYLAEIEHYFRARLVDGERKLSNDLWSRDYSSTDTYLTSVKSRREDWRRLLAPPDLEAQGDIEVRDCSVPDGRWVVVALDHHLTAQGLLVVPPGATKLVVFQHGLGSTPERVMGIGEGADVYDAVGARLVEAGYGVLAPMNLIKIPPRNRAQSLARLAGTTIEGLEFARFQRLLAAVERLAPDLDVGSYAFAGMSWGGLAAQFWSPLDDRIAAVATLGFFNDRAKKMVVQCTRYATFYDHDEDHAFLHGHLLGFGDADLASLICPRPFLAQHGKADRIGWWPQIAEEFERAKSHWDRLSLGELATMQMHAGGHEVDRSEEHTSELQSRGHLVCRLLLEKKKKTIN